MTAFVLSKEARRLAGISADARSICEEKVDLSIADIFEYLDRALSSQSRRYPSNAPYFGDVGVKDATTKNDPDIFSVGESCCAALERRGYDAALLGIVREALNKLRVAQDAREAGIQAFNRLSMERWNKGEV